jgi:hypothetical protein
MSRERGERGGGALLTALVAGSTGHQARKRDDSTSQALAILRHLHRRSRIEL